MTPRMRGLTVSALALTLCAAAIPAIAGDRHERAERRERWEHSREGEARERRWDDRRGWGGFRHDDRRYDVRRDDHRFGLPLPLPPPLPGFHAPRLARPHFDVFFGWGSGYRYGSPYSGRVYGWAAPSPGYGRRVYYGDVRLEVRPRDAAVWVDGYYAGIVDDFDGAFQRLTLEVGPHRIEIESPDGERRAYDVYVDPERTIDIHDRFYR